MIRIWMCGQHEEEPLKKLTGAPPWYRPYEDLPNMTGRWWEQFHSQDQAAQYLDIGGVLAATDGSSRVEVDESTGRKTHIAGAGVAYRRSDGKQDAKERVRCSHSSLVPEIHGVCMAIRDTPADVELTILTDSACTIWIVEALTRLLHWRDFRSHPQLEAVKALAEALDTRQAITRLVKVAAHKGCPMNERADQLAGDVKETDQATVKYLQSLPKELRVNAQPLSEMLSELSERLLARRQELLQEKRTTRTRGRLTEPGAGRQYFGRALQQLPRKEARRAVQITTGTFPSQARLFKWGKVQSPACPFCEADAETTEHFSQMCPRFKDARTAAHDKVWSAAWAEIVSRKPQGWEAIHDTALRNTPLRHGDEWADWKPDGIMLNATDKSVIILEFTRCGGHTKAAVTRAQDRKLEKYTRMAQHLQTANQELYPGGVTILALACTFSGVLDETHWRTSLAQVMELEEQRRDHAGSAMAATIKAALEAFSEMADLRLVARASPSGSAPHRAGAPEGVG
jgi:ribonuclease HI